MRLLVTRPEPDAQRTAARLRAAGHTVLCAPLLRLRTVAAALPPGPWAGVLVTSANAIRALADMPAAGALAALPLLAVGEATAAAARAAGFGTVLAAEGDAPALARLARRFGGSRLLYLAGAQQAQDLAGLLAPDGITVETVVVYRMQAAAAFPPPVRAALAAGALDGVLHYSRRSAETFLACADAADLRAPALALCHYCLSPAVAAGLVEAGAKELRVAPAPTQAALLALIAA